MPDMKFIQALPALSVQLPCFKSMHETLIRILYHATDCNNRVSRYCGVIPPDLFIYQVQKG